MKKVLIIENFKSVRAIAKIIRKRVGLPVLQSEDLSEVMQITQSGEVGMILIEHPLDNVYYPDKPSYIYYQGKPVDSIKITQMLKADSQTAHLPVILIISHHITDRENLLLRSGADDYILLPIVDHYKFIEQILQRFPL